MEAYDLRTPQNTPANNAPISSRAQQPGLSSLKEGELLSSSLPAVLNTGPTLVRIAVANKITRIEDFDKAAAAGLLAQNPALVSMMQAKLSGLVGKSSGYVESLPANVRKRVTGLKGVQKEHAKLEAQFQEEVLELEKKYFQKFTPLYQKRAKIVNGDNEPSKEEIEAGEAEEEDDDEEDGMEEEKTDTPADDSIKGIPEFWLSAMKNQVSLAEMISERDEEALKFLTDIRMEYLEKPGFKLIFEFAPNEFFTNKTVSKTYLYQEENGYGGDFIYDHAEGEKINWQPNKDLTTKIESKKQRNKSMFSHVLRTKKLS
jgi:nucleosome assembly protein 1-like 1